MSEPSNIKDYARKEWILFLAKMEDAEGKALTGVLAEAQLEAIAIWLRGSVGAEAAYNVFQRHADDIAGVLAQQPAGPQ